MNTINVKLSEKLKRIKIITLADLHIGDKHCNMKFVKELIEKIKNDKETYCVLNGDILDNAIMGSVASPYESDMQPKDQLYCALELLMPIKDKILCITSGNHEDRTSKNVGTDLSYAIAFSLGLKDRYCPDGTGVVFVSLGQMSNTRTDGKGKRQVSYSIVVSHGKRSGSTIGGKVNALKGYESVVTNADLYLGSHTHQASIFPTSSFEVDTRNHTLYKRDKLFVSNGSCLDYGGYGEKAMYQPQSMVYPTVELNGTIKNMRAYMEI